MPHALTLAVTALFALAVLGGCGADDSDSTESSKAADQAAGAVPDLQGTTISYLGFGGGVDERINAQLMDPFSKATGAEFILDQPTDYKKVEAQVKSGNVSYDLIDGDPYVVDAACGELYEPLDLDLGSVAPPFRPNSRCGAPDFVFGYVIAYDEEEFPDGGPQTCEDFFDTTKFPGKRALWSYYVSGIVECAAIAAGADPQDPYPLDLDAAFAKLDQIKDDISFYDTQAQAIDGMENQDVAMGLYTARSVVEADANGAPFVPSKEWAARAVGIFAVPKGAPHKEAAEAFLNFIMKPENYSEGLVPVYGSPLGGEIPADAKPIEKQLNLVTGPLKDKAVDLDWKWWMENVGASNERWSSFATG